MNVVNKFLGLKKNNRNAYFFFAVMCVFLVMFLISCIVNTCVYGNRFFVSEKLFFSNTNDWFMDFFNVNYFVANMNPYIDNGSSYPPLALLIAKLFSLCTEYKNSLSWIARSTVGGKISLVALYAIFFIISLLLLRKVCKKHGVSIWGTLAIFAGFFVSAPILFAVSRGNYLLLALMFSAIFLVYHDDESRWIREFSYISLAIAVGIKLYPAVFALVLLKDKRFLDFGKVVLYSICLVIFPFFAFKGGFKANVKYFLANLFEWTSTPDLNIFGATSFYSNNISVKTEFLIFCSKVSGKAPWTLGNGVQYTGLVLSILVAVALVAVSLISKSGWRRLSALGLIVALLPSVSYYYSVTFMTISFTAFLMNDDVDKKKIAYWVFYLIIFCPISIGYFIKPYVCGLEYGYTLMNWFQGLSMIAMAIMLFVESLIEFVKDRKAKKVNNSVKPCESLQQ